ncbi:glycoside hydrolase family 32 protein [Marispirochaeta aestuarii]|uniref:glycoside hydrolase family 32 protein n=1 Tax=Marispirochaeta aestuarii TaxID=1963862 RepID=UPI002ABDF1A0|nr:glycoside hydrolase family 32 protein [Marispirochaeta aestuarii]
MNTGNISPGEQRKRDRMWRPVCHFTPPFNWMNDPCGLVYFHGNYHLFYQHNPADAVWGSMHWGHAVSSDLLTWQDAPLALTPNNSEGMAFTGSAVVPSEASGGEGWKGESDAVVAIYTGAIQRTTPEDNHQRQCIATSRDGYIWDRGGVVLDNPGIQNFRDPKVGWYQETGHWFMVLAVERSIHVYTSRDLRSWKQSDTITMDAELPGGVLECPDLFPLQVINDPGRTEWVLVLHIENADSADPGAYYTLGSFDGYRFLKTVGTFLPIDGGHDFYATQSWTNMGPEDERRVWIAWSANPVYARLQPTSRWVGVLSIPREISLRCLDGRGLLCQVPVRELMSLRRSSVEPVQQRFTSSGLTRYYRVEDTLAWEILVEANFCRIILSFGSAGRIIIYRGQRTFTIDRTDCDMGRFTELVDPVKTSLLHQDYAEKPTTRVFFDRSILECFLDDGYRTTTDLVFPEAPLQGIEVATQSYDEVQVFPLEPVMHRDDG